MRKILLILILVGVGLIGKAQTNPFPSIDSLERFINRYIRNSAVEAFQNLRMNTAMIGTLRFMQNSEIGSGVDTMYKLNDSTVRLITHDPDTFDVTLRFAGGGGGPNTSVGSGFRWVVVGTQNIKSAFAGDGILIDSTSNADALTFKRDTSGTNGTVTRTELLDSLNKITITEKPVITKPGNDNSIPDTITVIYDDLTITIDGDSALTVDTTIMETRARGIKVADSIASSKPVPTLQQVTTAGATTTNPLFIDSAKLRAMRADSTFYVPNRTIADTPYISPLKGQLLLDDGTNSLWYRDVYGWTVVASLTNSLIPHRPNMRLIAGVVRPTVVGSTITWNWIINASHDSIGFGAVTCGGSFITLSLSATASKIHTILAAPDETLAQYIDVGISFLPAQANLYIKRRVGVISGYFQGNGTTYVWNGSSGGTGSVTNTYNTSTGQLNFDFVSSYTPPTSGTAVRYAGPNGYNIKRLFSGLSGNDRGYQVVDEFGNAVVGAPTSSDVIEVVVPLQIGPANINPCSAPGDGWASFVFGGGLSNIWIIGLVEY